MRSTFFTMNCGAETRLLTFYGVPTFLSFERAFKREFGEIIETWMGEKWSDAMTWEEILDNQHDDIRVTYGNIY